MEASHQLSQRAALKAEMSETSHRQLISVFLELNVILKRINTEIEVHDRYEIFCFI